MKVLWIAERFPPQRGGVAAAAGRQVALLAPHLERLDVLHLDAQLPAGWAETEDLDGARVHRLGRAASSEDSLRMLYEAAVGLGRSCDHDLVHGFYATFAGYVAVLAARRLDRPSVLSLRGNDVDRGLFQGSRAFFLDHALRHATAVTAVARSLLETVVAACGRSDGLHYIPNSVDCGAFTPDEVRPEGLAELEGRPRPWLGFAGELRFKKGLPVLLELAEHLERVGQGTVWLIGGVRADEAEVVARWRLRQAAAAGRLVELAYTRDRERLVDRYRAMDLMVFPSLWDGLPNALLEAMACARPVLATASGGMADVVEDGRTGYLADPTAVHGFAVAVDRVLALDRSDREAVGRAGRDWVAGHLTPEGEREALLDLYRRLAG